MVSAAPSNVYYWTGAGAVAQFQNTTSKGTTTINAIIQIIATQFMLPDGQQPELPTVNSNQAHFLVIFTAKYPNGSTASATTDVFLKAAYFDSTWAYVKTWIKFDFGSGVTAPHLVDLTFNFFAPTEGAARQWVVYLPEGILVNLFPAEFRWGYAVLTLDNGNPLLSVGGYGNALGAEGQIQVTLPF